MDFQLSNKGELSSSVAVDYYVGFGAPGWHYDRLEPLVLQAHDTFALRFGKPFW